MTSIIIASNKKSSGKTSLATVLCNYINSKKTKAVVLNSFFENDHSKVSEQLGIDVINIEKGSSKDLSEKDIELLSNEIKRNSKENLSLIHI